MFFLSTIEFNGLIKGLGHLDLNVNGFMIDFKVNGHVNSCQNIKPLNFDALIAMVWLGLILNITFDDHSFDFYVSGTIESKALLPTLSC